MNSATALSLFIFSVLFFYQVEGQATCNPNTTTDFCNNCARLGSLSNLTFPVTSVPFHNYCALSAYVSDNNSSYNAPIRCADIFMRIFGLNVTCQLAVFPNASYATAYAAVGLRNADRNMLIGLYRRPNCSGDWYYKAADGNEVSIGNQTFNNPDCNATQAAFVGSNLVNVNPINYTTNAALCQCAQSINQLPGTKKESTSTFVLTTIILMAMRFL